MRLTNNSSTSFTNKDGETIDNTTGDGYAPAYAGHTLKGTSETYNTIITGNPQLTVGAVETAITIGRANAKNQFGEVKNINYEVIFYAKQNATYERILKQFLNSTADVNEANPGIINTYKGMFIPVALPYLACDVFGIYDTTKSTKWGLISKQHTPFMFANEMDIEYETWEDKERKTWYSSAETAFGHCVVDGQGALFSNPS
jgi:hypothetical protein